MADVGARLSSSDPVYTAARRGLLDALEALQPHLDALVLVGAQAVYLRTHDLDLAVAPYTTDGDIVLDPRALSTEPDLSTVMEVAGFELATDSGGHPRPGVWVSMQEIDGRRIEVPIDLLVPAGVAPSRRRSARLEGHRKDAARTISGLEAAILDHAPFEIASLEPGDERCYTIQVAGPVALLIAKAYKLRERVTNEKRPDRLNDKDAGDVFRLMQASDVRTCVAVAKEVVMHDALGRVCREGLDHLEYLFKAAGTPGTAMAVSHLRSVVPSERVVGVSTAFVRALREGLSDG